MWLFIPFSRELFGFDRCLHQLVKCPGIFDRQVGQDFAIYIDAGLFHQLASRGGAGLLAGLDVSARERPLPVLLPAALETPALDNGEDWPIDVRVPPGARYIRLFAVTRGKDFRYDYPAAWINAGFVTK